MIIVILGVIGFLISLYSFIVFLKLKKNKNYKPLCDISDKISCSKAFLHDSGKLFGFPNPILGLIYYLIIILFFKFNLFYFSIIGLAYSLFFSYLLYFKVRSFCILCTTIHVINVLIFLFTLLGN